MPTRGQTVTGQSYVLKPRRRRKRWIALSMLVLVIAGHRWWGKSAEHEFHLAVAELRSRGEPTSPYQYQYPADPIPDSDNAARVVEAAALQIDDTDDFSKLDFQLPLTERESCLLEAHVMANTEPVAFLQRGHERKRAALDVHWQPMSFASPSLRRQAVLYTLLDARAILSHHNGNDRDALERVWDLLFLARVNSQLPHHGGAFDSSGAWTAVAIAPELDVLAHGTSDGRTSPVTVAVVKRIIDGLLDESHLKEGMRAHLRARRAELIEVFQMLALGKLGVDDLIFSCGNPMPSASGYPFKPLILRDAALVVKEFAAAIDAMEQPSLRAFRSAAPQLVRNGSILRFYATMLAPRYDDLGKRHYGSLAARRLAACALAIRWYQCDHDGRFPASLDALVPEYLPAVPLDPLAANDRPLTYVPDEPRPRIYSVGSDGQDDGGEPDGLEPSPLVSRREADLIADLRRPPRHHKERDYELIVEDLSAWDPK